MPRADRTIDPSVLALFDDDDDATCPEAVDPFADTAPHTVPVVPPRRSTSWLDAALRPPAFRPPPSRSAVQAHSTAPDGVGEPLPLRVRARMERALGGDLSNARVHIRPSPAEDERALQISTVLGRLGTSR